MSDHPKMSAKELKVIRYLDGRDKVARSEIREATGIPESEFGEVVDNLRANDIIGRYRTRGKWAEPYYFLKLKSAP